MKMLEKENVKLGAAAGVGLVTGVVLANPIKSGCRAVFTAGAHALNWVGDLFAKKEIDAPAPEKQAKKA